MAMSQSYGLSNEVESTATILAGVDAWVTLLDTAHAYSPSPTSC